jgi:BclA C-terminal domain
VPLDASVTFDSNGVSSPGITHAVGTAGITVATAGIYEIDFSASTVGPSQMAVFADEIPIPGSTYGSGAGTQQNSGQLLAVLSAGTVLTIRNHTSSAAAALQALAGGTQENANASVLIEKIHEAP